MKDLLVIFFVGILFSGGYAQSFPRLDKSPLDIAYYPHNFAHDREPGQEAVVKVIYSRPQKNGRNIFGGLVANGKIWRTGANESTEIRFYKDVEFGGKKVEAGTYSLFTIPGKDKWTIIINTDTDYWGDYSYRPENDVIRVTVEPRTLEKTIEAFSIRFKEGADNQAIMQMGWDKTLVEVPVSF